MHDWRLAQDLSDALQSLPPLPLGPGVEHREHKSMLDGLSPADFSGPGGDRNAASCCLSGIWLRFGYLDESHTISQAIHTAEGSYWHGIMHRHEPDYGNAKYWFRQTGSHPLFAELGEQSAALAAESACPAARQWSTGVWDPFEFVDFCEREEHGGANQNLAVALVQLEWDLLFEYCLQLARPTN